MVIICTFDPKVQFLLEEVLFLRGNVCLLVLMFSYWLSSGFLVVVYFERICKFKVDSVRLFTG